MDANELLKRIEADYKSSGGHCGESTSEVISRQRWEEKLLAAAQVIKHYLKS